MKTTEPNEADSPLPADTAGARRAGLPPEVARELSHRLRTPLSAMAGWLHLMETGSLDEKGLKRAIAKLQANIEDQVRVIDECLGETKEERH